MSRGTDTIVAIATAAGRGGVGIIRVSGSAATSTVASLAGAMPPARQASLRSFRRADGTVLDEGLLLYFPAPHSFTGEDVVELQAHGSPVALGEILEALCEAGARIARPGEFSERAFLNGRMDLAQAEAVADLIEASSRAGARAASRSVQGEFSRKIDTAVEALISLRVLLEAALDFSDEEVPAAAPAVLLTKLQALADDIAAVLHASQQGRRLREGMRVAIAGQPNVGKSTLLNRLAGVDAAIVSPHAGTTRDVLRESVLVDGLPLIIIDTAGLRETADPIEREGIRRARSEIAQAELVLLLVDDRDTDLAAQLRLVQAELSDRETTLPILIVRNKCDLSGGEPGTTNTYREHTSIRVSATSGDGLDTLKTAIRTRAGLDDSSTQMFSARARHVEALQEAALHIGLARNHAATQDAVLVAEELRLAQRALETITGRFGSEELLGRIFSSFCLGK